MSEIIDCDICVIGGGPAGLMVAGAAAQLGVPTILLEQRKMGGTSLNHGCVPSKALIAAANAADACRKAGRFGVTVGEPEIDFAAVHRHVHDVIAGIAPMDSVARFEGLGVRVIHAAARFTGPRELAAGDQVIRARRFVVATGSSPAVPPIPGLAGVSYLTNETVFDLTELPAHLIVIGGRAIALELAQAHARLGARVTVLEAARAMAMADPELAELLVHRLVGEGIEIREGARVTRIEPDANGVAVVLQGEGEGGQGEGGETRLIGSHLLIATGRMPHVDGLDLDKAAIAYDQRNGITVDARLRTTNRRVFAIGDVAGGQSTPVALHHAGIIIRNALLRMPAKADLRAVPRFVYTDPELASVGLSEAAARERHGDDIAILRNSFHENERALAERSAAGLVKLVTRRNGLILGAAILGPHAGELIQPWVLAIGQGLKIGALAGMIAPYPTLGEAGKRAAGSFFLPKLFSARTKKLVAFLTRFG